MTIKWNDYRQSNRRYITRAAVADLGHVVDKEYKPTWTIKDEDTETLYSLKKWFLNFYMDPTEMDFVNYCFEGDYKHWEVFKEAREFKPHYKLFREEADRMLQAEVMRRIIETAMDTSNKNSMTALKYLAEKHKKVEKKEEAKNVGRPKKEVKEETIDNKELLKDIARITGK